MDHGYDGARYMNEFAGNMLLWNVANQNMVTDQDWDNVYTYVNDKNRLGVIRLL